MRALAVVAVVVTTLFACAAPRPPAPADVVAPAPARQTTRLLLRLNERRLYLITDGGAATAPQVESFPVAIGREEYATPTGRFAVTDKRENPSWILFDWNDPTREFGTIPPGPDNPLGLRWIGFTSAHGWQIGFHGTPHPEALGKAVSHGCVRMRNADVVKVYDRVSIGTPVLVVP